MRKTLQKISDMLYYFVKPHNANTVRYSIVEQTNFNAILFIASLFSTFSCIFNFLELGDMALNIFTVCSSVFFVYIYYLSRFKGYQNIWIISVSILLILSVCWFMAGGSIGSTPYIYIISLIILIIITKGRQHNLIFSLYLINLTILYFLGYYYGDILIRPYASREAFENDMVFTFILSLFFVFFPLRFFKRMYDNEREKVEEQNKIIEEQNNELKLQAKELEQANEKRINTFVNLAHETKTPLTLINNYLEEYIHKNGQTKELEVIKNSIGKLTKDVVNFFDLERINKGFNVYDHNQCSDFGEILKECIILFRQYAVNKNVEITAIIDEETHIRAAPEAIQRVICNLIENAIKYSNENEKIIVTLKSKEGNLCFSVKDNGIGISPEWHKNIFEPYYQINSEKANFQGMGLGLSIIKKIIDELNGNIVINSDPPTIPGTEVIIQLPQHTTSCNEVVSELKNTNVYIEMEHLNINNKAYDENKPAIMIVEDNIPLLNYMVEKLQEKYNIYFALNGWEAFEKLKTIKCLDLLVSDVMMDKGNGFELYKNISSQAKFNHIPVIFLTAKTTTEDKMEGLALGAIDYIFKPFLIGELTSKIDSVLNNLSQQRRAIINQAYNSLISNNTYENNNTQEPKEVIDYSRFEDNCNIFLITTREKEIIKLIKKGQTYKEIADTLSISDKTVAKHLQNIFEKVNVTNKLELLSKLAAPH